MEKEPNAKIQLSRAVFMKTTKEPKKEATKLDLHAVQRKCSSAASKFCRAKTFYSGLLSFFPILTWLPNYQWRSNLLLDVLGGLTVGVLSIPQAMAYARLAGMPTVYGLYSNIIPPFIYILMGTTCHATIGPTTVLSLIMGNIRYRLLPCQDCWMNLTDSSNLSLHDQLAVGHAAAVAGSELTPIDVGTAVTFLVGFFMVAMGFFRLSIISDLLSDQLVGGFTAAASIHILAGQLPSMFGVNLPKREGVGKVVFNFIDLIAVIKKTNLPTFIIFATGFAFLAFTKFIINPRFRRLFRIPFPGEFLVMITVTLTSHYLHFDTKYDVSVVSHISTGMPIPSLPRFSVMSEVASDAFVLAIVTYTYSISLGKHYGKLKGYRVNPTQEFYAYGFMNVVGSFFQCFNTGQSLSRSLVCVASGAKTQICGLIDMMVVICTVLFIAPYMESLPNASLASIIVVAILDMLHNLTEMPALYRKSKYDFGIYIVTFLSVVVLDISYGLAASITFALITVVLQSKRSRVHSSNSEVRLLYISPENASGGTLSTNTYNTEKPDQLLKKVMVLRPVSPIFYVNAEKVKNNLLAKCLGDPSGGTASPRPNIIAPLSSTLETESKKAPVVRPLILIVDMASVAYIDLMGVNALNDVLVKLKENGIDLYLSACSASVDKIMKDTQFLDGSDILVFPTVLDAINYSRYQLSLDSVSLAERRLSCGSRKANLSERRISIGTIIPPDLQA